MLSLTCWSVAALALIAAVGPWLLSLFRDEPWFYGALRCLREKDKPGERGFWTRLMFKPAFVREVVGDDGRVSRVVVVLPDWKKVLLQNTLAAVAKDGTSWPDQAGRYIVNCSSFYKRHPGLRNVSTWGEFHPDYGARFVSERLSRLVVVDDATRGPSSERSEETKR
jgi:hypothetical protein